MKNSFVLASDFEKETGIRFTWKHEGKMKDLVSLSTSPLCNPLCLKRSHGKHTAKKEVLARLKNGKHVSICEMCFSVSLNTFRKGMPEKLAKNTDLLTKAIIPVEMWPYIASNSGLLRFESFGDLINEIQVVNYFNCARKNSHLACALWTKNPWIIESAFKMFPDLKKPENLTIIGSSIFINESNERHFKRYWFIDYIFTVYTKPYCKQHGIVITCGSRQCAKCRKCYEHGHDGYEIREELK